MNESNVLKQTTIKLKAIGENLTLGEELQLFLHKNGMFETQVNDVFKLIVADESMKEFRCRWDDKAKDYGLAPIVAMIQLAAKPIALKYIDDNCPEAWFRPMFLSLAEQTALMHKMK